MGPSIWAPRPRCPAPVAPTTPVSPAASKDAANIAARVSNLFHQGPKAVAESLADLDALALTALMTPAQQRAHTAEHAALKLALEGGATVAARVQELENLLTVALFTPEGAAGVQLELDVLREVSADFSALTQRADAISPSNDPSQNAADRIEANVLRALHSGYGGVQARIDELEQLKRVARFTPEGFRAVQAEVTTLNALLQGVPGVTAKREELHHLSTVARLTEDASLLLQLELDVLGRVEAATAHFSSDQKPAAAG